MRLLCCERPRAVLLQPCHHLCLCRDCAARVAECPMCRAAIRRRVNVFLS